LNANVHFHTLVFDGVFTAAREGALTFHAAPAPSDAEVAAVLATIRHRVQRLLVRRGLERADDATGPADLSSSRFMAMWIIPLSTGSLAGPSSRCLANADEAKRGEADSKTAAIRASTQLSGRHGIRQLKRNREGKLDHSCRKANTSLQMTIAVVEGPERDPRVVDEHVYYLSRMARRDKRRRPQEEEQIASAPQGRLRVEHDLRFGAITPHAPGFKPRPAGTKHRWVEAGPSLESDHHARVI
jgi:hypothetical protein